jgi:outer membrane protein assembly factor BamA
MLKLMICGKRYAVNGVWFTVCCLWLLVSCNYTKHLAQNEYALIKNTVKVEEAKKSFKFDDLIDLVRPIPNKKFMEIFPIKVSLWANHQPPDSINGKKRDSKFNQWCRKVGEPPVLIDTIDIHRSIAQIKLAMFKCGYFDAETEIDIQYLKKQKARINYLVTPNQPYYIRSVDYQIDIPEYKRIVITDTANSLLKKDMIYNEDIFVAERNRIVSKIKDQGYFYTTSNIVTFLVDTNDSFKYPNANRYPTFALTIRISFDDVNDEQLISKSKNRYRFNNVLIYTNYDLNFEKNLPLDTIQYSDYRNKSDSTLYEFVTIKKLKRKTNKLKLVKDFKSRTIAGTVWMKKGDMFSQTAYDRTYKKLRDLRNFSMINIIYNEDESTWDSIYRIGALNTTLRLTRAKQHSLGSDFDLRTDKTSLALSYTNKNIFRRAEYLNISAYGSLYYNRWFNAIIKKEEFDNFFLIYGEFGGSASLEFPRLLMLPQHQNINFWSYSTEIKFTCNYSQYMSRLNLQAAYTYKWAPTRFLMHSVSPVDLSTLDSRSNRNPSFFDDYPNSYLRKFDKFFLPSAKYMLNYVMPNKTGRHLLRINFSFETVGLLLYSINSIVNKDEMWSLMNKYKYGTYEKFDFTLTYSRIINKNNAFAMRFIFGMAIPYKKGTVIPFERSFFVGGANSMRGWVFRQLGPGGYYSGGKAGERVGDMKLELNLEYRGPIYKAFKFGVFSDIGNVWLLSKYDEMPDAEFNFKTFYKQIAICVGLGLRLDFNFFVIRLDYGLPIYDPSNPIGDYWINKNWFIKENKFWNGAQGIQLGINYAF